MPDLDFYRSLPKIDLHRHLEGSLRLATLAEIGRTYDLDVPARDMASLGPLVEIQPVDPPTHQNFLSKFGVLRHFFCSPDVIRRITREAIEDAAADNVIYLELRFTPVRAQPNSRLSPRGSNGLGVGNSHGNRGSAWDPDPPDRQRQPA